MLKNILGYASISIINKAIPFLLLPFITKFISPDGYALLAIWFFFLSLFEAFTLSGMNAAYIYNVINGRGENYSITIGFTIILINALLLGVILFLIYCLNKNNIAGLKFEYVFFALIVSIESSLTAILLSHYQYKKELIRYALVTISSTGINSLISIILIYLDMGWQSRIYAAIFSYLISLYYLFKIINFKFTSTSTSKVKADFLLTLKYGINLLPHTFSGVILYGVDRVMLQSQVTQFELGVYSLGYQFGALATIIFSSVNAAWSPTAILLVKDKNIKLFYTDYKRILINSIFMVIVLYLISHFYITLIVDNKYSEAIFYLPIIMISYIFEGAYSLAINYFYANNKGIIISKMTLIAVAVNILSNFVLIERIGAMGASISTLLAYLTILMIVHLMIYKDTKK